MKRIPQIILISSFLGFSWLGMQAVHELGHVITAMATGGKVERVALHPLAFSRTDLSRNPHPLAVAWGGPLVGVMLPSVFWAVWQRGRMPGAYMPRFFAGFCLVANGAYVGGGSFAGLGDAGDMLRHGCPQWVLIGFAVATLALGLYLWHRLGPSFGLGKARGKVSARAALISAILFVIAAGGEAVIAGR